jgi:hypothetical protein
VPKLDQKRATASTDSGTTTRWASSLATESATDVAAHSQAVKAASTGTESSGANRGAASGYVESATVKLLSSAAADKEAVGIVAVWQRDPASVDALLSEPAGKRLRRLPTTAIRVGVKGEIDGSRGVAELPELARVEMGSQRVGDVLKSGLPHRGVVEQPFDEDHFRIDWTRSISTGRP